MGDFQYIVAELSLALAGFSGVIVAITKQLGSSIHRADTLGLVYILLSSGTALIFSMAPFVLIAAGLEASLALDATGWLLAGVMVTVTLHAAYANKGERLRYPKVFWGLVVSGLLIAISHLVITTITDIPSSMYPLMLMWLLLVGFVQFSIFIFVEWLNNDEA